MASSGAEFCWKSTHTHSSLCLTEQLPAKTALPSTSWHSPGDCIVSVYLVSTWRREKMARRHRYVVIIKHNRHTHTWRESEGVFLFFSWWLRWQGPLISSPLKTFTHAHSRVEYKLLHHFSFYPQWNRNSKIIKSVKQKIRQQRNFVLKKKKLFFCASAQVTARRRCYIFSFKDTRCGKVVEEANNEPGIPQSSTESQDRCDRSKFR
jgi:hypothetical protein